jgi:hypothetical protein
MSIVYVLGVPLARDCHSDDSEGANATEEEWRNPENCVRNPKGSLFHQNRRRVFKFSQARAPALQQKWILKRLFQNPFAPMAALVKMSYFVSFMREIFVDVRTHFAYSSHW